MTWLQRQHTTVKPRLPYSPALRRLKVYYRRLGQVMAMVVAPPGVSALAAVQLLQTVARICFAACKGPDITAQRLTRKFPEVAPFPMQALHVNLAGQACNS